MRGRLIKGKQSKARSDPQFLGDRKFVEILLSDSERYLICGHISYVVNRSDLNHIIHSPLKS